MFKLSYLIQTTVRDSDYCSRHAGASGLVCIILVWYHFVFIGSTVSNRKAQKLQFVMAAIKFFNSGKIFKVKFDSVLFVFMPMKNI